jgi:hypothetical protein
VKRSLLTSLTLAGLIAACGLPPTGPIALDDSAAVEAGGEIMIQALANDRATPGDTLTITRVEGARGEARIANGGIAYSAPEDFAGDDTFRYFISGDPSGEEASANIVVSVTAATATTTTLPDGELLLTTGPHLELGTVFATQMVEGRVGLEAVDADFFIDEVHVGDVSLIPDPECSPLNAGHTCEATVLWSPTAPHMLEETITISGGVQLTVTGEALSPLTLSPEHQELGLPLLEAIGTFETELSNVASSPVHISDVSGFGAFETASISSQCPWDDSAPVLDAGASCVITVSTEIVDVAPGAVFEGGLRVSYGTSSVEATAMIELGGLEPPSWIRPVPGQGIWWEVVQRGFEVDWEDVPQATGYGLEARICWNDDSDCVAIGEPQVVDASSGFVEFPIDLAPLDTEYLVARELGHQPVIVLTTYAIGTDADDNEITSEPAESRHEIKDGPFDLFDIAYNPPPGTSLECDSTRLYLSVVIQSNLLDPAELTAQLFGDQNEAPHRDPVTATIVPSVEPGSAEMSLIPTGNTDIESVDLLLDSHFGSGDVVQFPVSGCDIVG